MSPRDVLLRNTFWHVLVTVIGLGIGVLMSVVLARGLGPARMGDYSYVLWASRTLMALATLGFALAAVRYSASALAQGNTALAWGFVELLRRRQLVSTALVVAVAVPVVFLTAPADLRWSLVVVALALFPVTLEHIYSHAIYGAQRFEYTAQASTVKMLLQLGAAVLVLSLGFDILGLVIANTVATVISCEIQRARLARLYPSPGTDVPPAAREELRTYLVPLSVVVVLDSLVWDRSEVFFLRLWTSSHDIAFYSLAFGLATKAMVLPEATVGALLPTFSALHGRGGTAEFRAVYRSALRYVSLASVAIAAIGIAAAPALVVALYGAVYAPVASLFSVLIVVAVFAALRRVALSALRGVGDRRCAVTATSIAAVVNIGAAVVLIPQAGVWGAVTANSVAQVVATAWVLTVMGTTYGCGFPLLDLVRIVGAGGVALAASFAVAGTHPSLGTLALAAAAGFSVYVAACALTGVIGARDWRLVMNAIRRLSAPAAPSPPATPATPEGDAASIPPAALSSALEQRSS